VAAPERTSRVIVSVVKEHPLTVLTMAGGSIILMCIVWTRRGALVKTSATGNALKWARESRFSR
jgi:hypothetical protein